MSLEAMPLRLEAIVFDAYGTLFDVHSVMRRCESLYPGRHAQLSQLWRAKQLAYTWLRSLMQRHAPFSTVTREALAYACEVLGLELTAERMEALMAEYNMLSVFPDVPGIFARMRGVKRAILSNGSPDMLEPVVRASGLGEFIRATLSVDALGIYKPRREVYQLASAKLGVHKEAIGFVSSNCWDACGAKSFGFTTFWINRTGAPVDALDADPDHVIGSLADLPALVGTD